MPIGRWKPLRMPNLFEKLFYHRNRDLAVDVYEKDNEVIVEIQIPGIEPDKIEMELEDTRLHICASREEKEEVKNKDYYYKEIRRGSFERSVELPCPVDPANTRAKLSDGILKISLPKKEKTESSEVKV